MIWRMFNYKWIVFSVAPIPTIVLKKVVIAIVQ